MKARQTSHRTVPAVLLALCLALLLPGLSCRRAPKAPPAQPLVEDAAKPEMKPLGKPDKVILCIWDDAALNELDRDWPLPYDWQALLFRNLNQAGTAVAVPYFSLDSPRADAGGGARLAHAVNALAGSATATQFVLPAEPPAALLHHWPPLALRNDDTHASWASLYPQLPEGEEPVRRAALLPMNPAPLDNLSLEAAAAAAFLGLDGRALLTEWARLSQGNEKYVELPFGDFGIPAAEIGGYYSFGLRPYPGEEGFPELSCRDVLLMNLDPSPVVAPIAAGETRPPNADLFYWLNDVQAAAYPPRVIGTFTLKGLVPTSALALYHEDRPTELLIGGIDRNEQSGAVAVFNLDNPDSAALTGSVQRMDFIPLAMALNRRLGRIAVFDGKKKAVLSLDPDTLLEKGSYALDEKHRLLADPGPYLAAGPDVPTFPIQMAVSPASDVTYILAPYTDTLMAYNPGATPAVRMATLPEKAFSMELTGDAQYLYLLGAGGHVLSGRAADLKFTPMTFPDAGVAWTAPAAFHFHGLDLPPAGSGATPARAAGKSATATTAQVPSVPDYRSLFTIDAQQKNIVAVNSSGESKPLRLYASAAHVKPDLAPEDKIKVEPVTLIHTPGDPRLFVLLRVVQDSTGKLPPHMLGIIDPYSRNWLTTVVPVPLAGMVTTFTAGDLIVMVAPGGQGLQGVVVDTGAALRGVRRDMARDLRGRVVLMARDYSGTTPMRLLAGVDSTRTFPPYQISATAIQNLINGDFGETGQ